MLLFWCCCFLPAVSLALPEFDIQTGKNFTPKKEIKNLTKQNLLLLYTIVTALFMYVIACRSKTLQWIPGRSNETAAVLRVQAKYVPKIAKTVQNLNIFWAI
jgi:hypothetical protein